MRVSFLHLFHSTCLSLDHPCLPRLPYPGHHYYQGICSPAGREGRRGRYREIHVYTPVLQGSIFSVVASARLFLAVVSRLLSAMLFSAVVSSCLFSAVVSSRLFGTDCTPLVDVQMKIDKSTVTCKSMLSHMYTRAHVHTHAGMRMHTQTTHTYTHRERQRG